MSLLAFTWIYQCFHISFWYRTIISIAQEIRRDMLSQVYWQLAMTFYKIIIHLILKYSFNFKGHASLRLITNISPSSNWNFFWSKFSKFCFRCQSLKRAMFSFSKRETLQELLHFRFAISTASPPQYLAEISAQANRDGSLTQLLNLGVTKV